MGPLLVVEGQISPNPLSGLSPILVCLQVTPSLTEDRTFEWVVAL